MFQKYLRFPQKIEKDANIRQKNLSVSKTKCSESGKKKSKTYVLFYPHVIFHVYSWDRNY